MVPRYTFLMGEYHDTLELLIGGLQYRNPLMAEELKKRWGQIHALQLEELPLVKAMDILRQAVANRPRSQTREMAEALQLLEGVL